MARPVEYTTAKVYYYTPEKKDMEKAKIEKVPMDGGLVSSSIVRFDCLVELYDTGSQKQIVPSIIPFLSSTRRLRSELFRTEFKFTLEELRAMNESHIGSVFKKALAELDNNIKKWEKELL